MRYRARLFVFLLSTPLVVFVLVGGFLGKASAREDSYQHLRVFEDVVSLVLNNYVEEVNVDRIMEGAMRGLADGLDADSAWLTPEQVSAVESGEPLPAGETGLELTRRYYLVAISARDGSPAARAGLRTGDFIRAIDGKSTRDMSVFEGERRLRGEPGTTVRLTVLRGSAADPHDVELTREVPSGPVVTARMQEPGVGYVRIVAFDKGVTEALHREVTNLQKTGAARLVIDLRGTAQGELGEALDASRLFVGQGTLVTREARGEAQTPHQASGSAPFDLPIVLLSTTGTSGPAEIFAAALVGNKRAELVGEQTLGRAAEQHLVKLPDGSGLWMTYARYLTPDGKPIHGAGLKPSVEVDEPDVEFGSEPQPGDPILDRALERLRMNG